MRHQRDVAQYRQVCYGFPHGWNIFEHKAEAVHPRIEFEIDRQTYRRPQLAQQA